MVVQTLNAVVLVGYFLRNVSRQSLLIKTLELRLVVVMTPCVTNAPKLGAYLLLVFQEPRSPEVWRRGHGSGVLYFLESV